MAGQIPYSPIPQVEPQQNPTPTMNIAVNADMFGAGIGVATQHLGKVMESANNELFDRALKLKAQADETEAKQADADYIVKAGEMHAKYQSLSGLEAVHEYPNYVKGLQDLRSGIKKGLSNPQAQQLFDGASLGTMSRTIFSGAGHSATENKKAALGASTARVDAASNQALLFPADEEKFKQTLGVIDAEVRSQGIDLGWDQDTIKQKKAEKISEAWEKRIQGMSKNDPFTAQKMLDKASAEGALTGEANGRVTEFVRKQLYTVGARNISASISGGGNLSFGERVVPITAAKLAIGSFESGGNYQALGKEVFDKKTGASRGRALGKYQVMPENLGPWLKEAGLQPMTPQEFLNNPDAQEAVFETKFGQYMKQTGTFNDAASMWFSGKPRAQLKGGENDTLTTVPGYLANTNAILAKNASLADRIAVGKAEAEKIAPNDKLFPDYVADRVTIDHNKAVQVKKDDEWRNNQLVTGGLIDGKDGQLPTTVEELRAVSPEVAAAYDASSKTAQLRYNRILAQNSKDDVPWTDEALKTKQRLQGLAQSDPVEFLNTDIIEMEVPRALKKEMLNLQDRIKKDAAGDPRVRRAMSELQPTLNAVGLDRRKDKDLYDQFQGALMDQLRDYRETNKKEMPLDEIRKTGARLLQLQAGSGYFGTNMGRSEFYRVKPAQKVYDDVRAQATKAGMPPPTDDQIEREYRRMLYQSLYGKPAPAAKPPGSAPTVPTSQ